ncbi:MAG TPA: type II toxin-antitoxin system RelE/ParE family toxin [Candidatus Angelobacter sp.]
MKRYEVIVTPEAEAAIISAFDYIDERAPLNAERWLRKLYSCITSLENFPHRCALARECQFFDGELRQLIFKSHRIVFRIEEEQAIVRVVHFLHGRQLAVGEMTGGAEEDPD